jgi:hypothetical protein
MTSLSVCSFPEAPNLAESSSKSRRNFFGSLFGKRGVPFLKGFRRLGKARAKNSVVHPVDDVLLPPPSAARFVFSISNSAPHLTSQNSSRPPIDPNPRPTITIGKSDPATLTKELKKAHRSSYSSCPVGNSVYAASQNTLSSAEEHAIAPNVDVEQQRNPFLRALVNIKSFSTTSLVGSSGHSSVPSRTLSPSRPRFNSETTVTRSSASTAHSGPWTSEGKEAEPVLHIVDTAASESEQAGLSSNDPLQESSSESVPQQPRQRHETRAATATTTTTIDKRTPSNEFSNSNETPLLVPRFLNVYIAHMRSGSRPIPVSSPSRLPKPSPPTPTTATTTTTSSGPNSPRSGTASLPDRPTTTSEGDNNPEEQEGTNEGRGRSSRPRPSQLPVPVVPVPRTAIAIGVTDCSEPVALPAVVVADSTRSHQTTIGSSPCPSQPPSFLLTSPTPTERHYPQPPRGRARSRTVAASTTTTAAATAVVESGHARSRTISASRTTTTTAAAAAESSRGARLQTISTFSSTTAESSSPRKRTVSGSTTTAAESSRGTRSRTTSAASASTTAGARNRKKPESSPTVRSSSSSAGRGPRPALESPSFANRELPPSRLPVVVVTGKHSV